MESLSPVEYTRDALILAGDVSDDGAVLEATLRAFTARFAVVFFVPGNHELWVARKASTPAPDSLAKLHDVLALCARLGVRTAPELVGDGAPGCTPVWVVPVRPCAPAFVLAAPQTLTLTSLPARSSCRGTTPHSTRSRT